MRHGLATVAAEQERYFSERDSYAGSASELDLALPQGVEARILEAGPSGWAAEAIHAAFPGRSCVMYAGTVATTPTTARERARPSGRLLPTCDER